MTKMKTNRDSETGRLLPGNEFWKGRSSHGAKPKFEDPDDLWAACVEYFEWVEANPLLEDKLIPFQGKAGHETVRKMRAMTITGLCGFLDISQRSWGHWRSNRIDLSEVIERVESIIYQQKFEGAAADLLNANIISRELGLSDKKEHTSPDGSMSPAAKPEFTKIEIARQVAFMLAEGMNELKDQQGSR